ncbi:MAG: glycoside hydrolase family 127 protein [Thermoguttaceae bacterium]|nr:glycoside hydrolase family 127 protein [Thermoguttaceae bacterium]MDW8078728.1 glycoside hydrolase family 127 protein [Thermoguttaceae bacterium]
MDPIRKIIVALMITVLTMSGLSAIAEEKPGPPPYRKLQPVPHPQVRLTDGFWAKRIEVNRVATLPHNVEWCEKTGRLSNFDKAAGKVAGKFEGIYFNDSDVYKVLEGAAHILAATGDPQLDKELDTLIARIAAAQQPDGYLNTFFTLVDPQNRWADLHYRHQLYLAGHLFEAAVAHYRATGKRNLFDVAERFADLIVKEFGPGKRLDPDGHQEIELALIKLFEVTGKREYLELAKFFIDVRGDASRRQLWGPNVQDHKPFREQEEIVGHAVRAMYMCCGAADLYAWTGEEALLATLDRLWADLTQYKLYITGGIGARGAGEAFGERYELPNAQAYAETCAAIGLVLWNWRMALLKADARYVDIMEQALYNGFLSGVSLDGRLFFYVNPLESAGNHHRQPFYDCACCPTNVVRIIPQVPGLFYAQDATGVYVHLYGTGVTQLTWNGTPVEIRQRTEYPWDGRVELILAVPSPVKMALRLRIPGWCRQWAIAVNGRKLEVPCQQGYAVLEREWTGKEQVLLEFAMPVERIEAHPAVLANRGRVAIRRGPIVYCFEQVDNGGPVRHLVLAKDPQFQTSYRADLLGGVVVVHALDAKGQKRIAIPYYAWDHREPGEMIVWVRQQGKPRQVPVDDPSWKGLLYRVLTPESLTSEEEWTLSERAVPSASHCAAQDTVTALNDLIEPANSCDLSIPRFTWWDRRGTKEWVQYEFGEPVRVQAVGVYWFDDGRINRHCRVPASWQLLYRKGDQWVPVKNLTPYGTQQDRYNWVRFEPVETSALRIEVQLDPSGPWSGGILEWKVE